MRGIRSTRAVLALLACGLAVAALLPIQSPASGQAQPEAGSSDWRTVSVGRFFSCGIRTSGLLYCWGSDDAAQLGNGAATGDQPVPVLGGNGWNDWKSVSAGWDFACGVRGVGAIYCWGANGSGQLGNGTTDTFDAPTAVGGANNYWTSVSAGAYHACGRANNGRLFCWGANNYGQLGIGTAGGPARTSPRPVRGGFTDWTSVDVGERQTCGRRANGRIYCWGNNDFGELGDGTTNPSSSPRLVAGGITNWSSVDTASTHTCARRANGRLYCWGGNDDGQLGDGSNTDQLRPHLVPGPAVWTAVATAGRIAPHANGTISSTCARRNTGQLYCWGANGFNQLGDGTDADRAVPTLVAGGATDWRTFSVGMYSACATTTDSRAYCWGWNFAGQLGTNDGIDHPRPQEVWAGGSPGGGGSSGTSSGGSSGTSSGGSSGTTSSGGSSGTSNASSLPSGSNGMTSSALFFAVAAVLAAAAAVLIDGRRWQPLDACGDATI